MRKIFIAGNWKMNKTFSEADDFIAEAAEFLKGVNLGNTEVIICPPAVFIELATDVASESDFYVGAQNVSEYDDGAFTGEVSANMLRSCELDFCIVGHSERRKYFQDYDDVVNKKIRQLHKNDVVPIFCVGETLEEREKGITQAIVLNQLEKGLKDVEYNGNLLIAYEPVWAIGTGKTATPEQAQEIHGIIRHWLSEKYDEEVSEDISILYGGSVKPENIQELLFQKDIDGGLIGGAALDIEKFKSMIELAAKL
jgi:triosephosphate isomerase (TIM)